MKRYQKSTTEKLILISNIGSSSRKYLLYSLEKDIDQAKPVLVMDFDKDVNHPEISLTQAFYALIENLEKEQGLGLEDIDVILERVVAVGKYFLKNRVIDKTYLQKLKLARRFDDIHTSSLLNELKHIFILRRAHKQKGKHCKFKLVGISDSEFHSTIPKTVYTYALPNEYSENILRKFGYHGISMSEVAHKLSLQYQNILAVHLGGGGSVTAIKNGQSIYNSFGMTPVSGIINMTRVGDIDALAVLDLVKEKSQKYILARFNFVLKKVKKDLYKNSGMLALTGEFDMRNILNNLKSTDQDIKERSSFALQVYLERIKEFIGAAYSHLGKVDALALTGPILGNDYFREIFLKKIDWLPVKVENIKVIKTKEEGEMLRLARRDNLI